MQNEDENPLHDIQPEIAYDDLAEIDLEPYFGATDEIVAEHIRSLANRASIGQLREALSIPLDGEDREKEVLVDMFVNRKMAIVQSIKLAMQSI
jgi:hypothetical protein